MIEPNDDQRANRRAARQRKQRDTDLQYEYRAALAYYRKTVWDAAYDVRLIGPQYDVALLAWERLRKAQCDWFNSLKPDERSKARQAAPDIEGLRPKRLERDDRITPEALAEHDAKEGVALKERYKRLLKARDFLDALPALKAHPWELDFDAFCRNDASFDDILSGPCEAAPVSLLPLVQTKRNKGKLSPRALEQALKRHADGASEIIQREMAEALKNKVISCKCLEEIRWQRFRNHYKRR
jgi:hypothetical protein